MSPTATVILIIVILVVVAAVVYGIRVMRRKQLQNTFGPEYDRVVADSGNRTEGERELREREKRHAALELKPLSPEAQATYSANWEEVQIQFVDDPTRAVTAADELVTRLIADRGYPTGEYDDRLADLSVEHARTLEHYRKAHEISKRNTAGEANTEDLRQALVHYRALFADLLGTDPMPSTGTASTSTTAPAGTTSTGTTSADTTVTGPTATGTTSTGPTSAGSTEESSPRSQSTSEQPPAPRTAADESPARDTSR